MLAVRHWLTHWATNLKIPAPTNGRGLPRFLSRREIKAQCEAAPRRWARAEKDKGYPFSRVMDQFK
jgi:hypothetical protein